MIIRGHPHLRQRRRQFPFSDGIPHLAFAAGMDVVRVLIGKLTAFTTTTTGCNPYSDRVRVLPGLAGNDNSNQTKTGPAARFSPHLTRHTKTNGNKLKLLKTLSDEGDDSTLLCNDRGAAFPFAASPQSPGVAVTGAPPFGFKGGSFFRFCLRFCFSLSSRQSEATRDLS